MMLMLVFYRVFFFFWLCSCREAARLQLFSYGGRIETGPGVAGADSFPD
jgi:hypothetical protein